MRNSERKRVMMIAAIVAGFGITSLGVGFVVLVYYMSTQTVVHDAPQVRKR